jgi:hypothetical protein
MKFIKPLIFILALCTMIYSCRKSDNNSTTNTNTNTGIQKTPYTAGQTLTYSFVSGSDTLVKMRDIVMNYGFEGFPVLLLVHQQTLIKQPGWGSVFFPLTKPMLDSLLVKWAKENNMSYQTVQEKSYVARNFLDFILSYDLDPGLFAYLMMGQPAVKISSVIQVVSVGKKQGDKQNSYLLRMIKDKISPEQLLSDVRAKGPALSIVSIFLGIPMIEITWCKFADNSGPVANAPSNYASFLCSSDTMLSHYSGGTAFRSGDYQLSYDAGLWEAKCTYHIEGIYGATNPNYAGLYIPKCNTISTYTHVKGPDFIVQGNVGYSPAVNSSQSWDNPIVEEDGSVQVEYGDCCCFRKFSNLNFKVDGNLGYTESSWDPGK